jgi:hypothetical protein
MDKTKSWYAIIIIDYLFEYQLSKVTIKDLMNWSEFLYEMKFENTADIYKYLDNKLIKIFNANT